MPRVRALLGAGARGVVFCALTVVLTWPLLSTRPSLPNSDDAYFTIWRLAWVAHQLPRDPQRLFDANIFHPATGTLAFSDAMLLVGVAGAPLIWLGVDPERTHNILMAAGFVSSMWCGFLLVRHLSGSSRAGWLAALIIGFAPYRFAHLGHLELQWIMWMPLSLLLLHRLIDRPTVGRALALGGAVAAQTLCSIYYGLFLSCYLGVAWLALMWPRTAARARAARLTPLAVVPLLAVVLIYGPPYARTRAEHGPRSAGEIGEYSAVPGDLLRVPPHNWLRGASDGRPTPEERSLFPGAVALVLAAVAFLPPVSRLAWMYLGLGAMSADLALGVNGLLFPWLQQAAPVVTSLRSPARFAVLLLVSVAVLAGLGAARLFRAWPRHATAIATIAALACVVEYWSAPVGVRAGQSQPTEAHRWLSYQPAGTVVLEMPIPRSDALWLHEAMYQLRSIHHWQRLVNGYSGFAPSEYTSTLDRLRGFPDTASVRRLRELNVRFVLLNRVYYSDEEFAELTDAIAASPSFWPPQSFGTGDDEIAIVEVKAANPVTAGVTIRP